MRRVKEKWPDDATEKTMLEDADLCASESDPTSAIHDAACHIRALLERVRDLEKALAEEDAVHLNRQQFASDVEHWFAETFHASSSSLAIEPISNRTLLTREQVLLLLDHLRSETCKLPTLEARLRGPHP